MALARKHYQLEVGLTQIFRITEVTRSSSGP